MSQGELVRLERGDAGVATLTLANAGMRNAITRELSVQMNRVLAQVAGEREIRALIVTGEGEESFCAGMSLPDFLELRRGGRRVVRARARVYPGGRYQMGEVQARSWITGRWPEAQQPAKAGATARGWLQSIPAFTQMRWLQRQLGFSSTRA